jgi:hypothetical protein
MPSKTTMPRDINPECGKVYTELAKCMKYYDFGASSLDTIDRHNIICKNKFYEKAMNACNNTDITYYEQVNNKNFYEDYGKNMYKEPLFEDFKIMNMFKN